MVKDFYVLLYVNLTGPYVLLVPRFARGYLPGVMYTHNVFAGVITVGRPLAFASPFYYNEYRCVLVSDSPCAYSPCPDPSASLRRESTRYLRISEKRVLCTISVKMIR